MKCFGLLAVLAAPFALAESPTKNTSVDIDLFGQPCKILGPFEASVLKSVHSISPEQIYPEGDPAFDKVQASSIQTKLDVLKKAAAPAALAIYKQKMSARIEAQHAFLQAVDQYKKTKKIAALEKVGTQYLKPPFQAQFKKFLMQKMAWSQERFRSLFEFYNSGIEPEPEEEFHRVVRSLKIDYQCSFEADGDSDAESDGDGDPKLREPEPSPTKTP